MCAQCFKQEALLPKSNTFQGPSSWGCWITLWITRVHFTRWSQHPSVSHWKQQGFSKPLFELLSNQLWCTLKFEKEKLIQQQKRNTCRFATTMKKQRGSSFFAPLAPVAAGGSSIPVLPMYVIQSLSPYWFWQAAAAALAVLVLGLIALKAATDAAAGAAAGAASREWGSGEPALALSRSPYRSSAPRSCNQAARKCWNPWSGLGGPWRAAIRGWSLLECQYWRRNKIKVSLSSKTLSVIHRVLHTRIFHWNFYLIISSVRNKTKAILINTSLNLRMTLELFH